jgi:hypothetical protein
LGKERDKGGWNEAGTRLEGLEGGWKERRLEGEWGKLEEPGGR